jgi:hypothetical protein
MDKRKSLLKLIYLNIGKFFSVIKDDISGKYDRFKDRLEQNTKDTVDSDFEDLAPVDEIENGEEYFKALDWALNDEKVFNIAMTGPYGSGKSSVIRAYLKKHPSMKTINISLASFLEAKDDGKGGVLQSLVDIGGEEKIEEGILKQLFYKVDYKKIPQSRYRKLHNVNGIRIFRNLVLLALIVVGTVFFFFVDEFKSVVNFVSYTGNLHGIGKVLSMMIAITIVSILLGLVSYFLWWLSSKYKIKQLNLMDKASITSKEEEKESIFNKNMDEIVYFFEATDFDMVFIEDLDRFESAEIFIKLRELNTILNNYEMIKRRIVFLYAIKDDMFIDKERTKFFEFIIPVIPIINSTNSGEVLLKRLMVEGSEYTMKTYKHKTRRKVIVAILQYINKFLEKISTDDGMETSEENKEGQIILKYNISAAYITQVSPYIDDMRVLTNVYNEFVIYKNTLSTKQGLTLIDEQMISLIIFKNLYPKDFADLQMEEGIVKQAFSNKKDYILKKTESLRKEKEEAVQILKSIDDDLLANVNEVKASMLYYFASGQGAVYLIIINGTQYPFKTIMQDEFDMNILRNTKITVYYIDSNGSANNRSVDNIDDITKASGNKIGFIERCKYLKDSIPERKDEIKKKIQKLDVQIHSINALSLKDLIGEAGSDNILSESVQKNKLLVFLLREGYIDEIYANYMNYFHPNSITKDDMNFILSVRNHEARDYSYKLTKLGQVVERLLEIEFEQKEIYNFDLLDYLLKNKADSNQCKFFINQLSDAEGSSWQFINEFIDRTDKKGLFIELLANAWTGMWNYIYINPTLTENRKTFYFKLILINVKIEQIEKMNYALEINQFMENNIDILSRLSDVNIPSIKMVINRLNIIFKELECDSVSEELLEYIFENNHYEINMSMINNIVMLKHPEKIGAILTSNYTVIRDIKYQPLLDYIDENFKEYIDNIVLANETNTCEAIETVLSILNKIADSPDMCIALIEKEDIVLQKLEECCLEKIKESNASKASVKKIWDKFLTTGKVIISWSNVVAYWGQFNLSNVLLKYIEQNMDKLLNDDNSELLTDDLIKSVIIENMELGAYRKFVSRFIVDDFTNEFSEFTEEQIEILLNCSYFELTPERFTEMKENHPDLSIEFLLQNKETFFTDLDNYTLEISDIEALVNSPELTAREKLSIIKTLNVSAITVKIARVIRVMQNNVDKSIVNRVWQLLPINERYELFLNQINLYTLDELADKFTEFGGVYAPLADRTKRHNVSLDDVDYNRKLMEYLKSVDYLTSIDYEVKEIDDRITYKKIASKYIVGRVKAKK